MANALVAVHGNSRKRARDTSAPAVPRAVAIEWTESDPFIKGIMAVSNRNRVRDQYGRIYKAHTNGAGYLDVRIGDKLWMHHLLVYVMWYGRQPEGQIDHIDRNRSNNRPENLEDVTPAENVRRSHADANRRSGVVNRSKPIIGQLPGMQAREFASTAVAADELNLHRASVTRCCKGDLKTTGGWTFAYHEQHDLENEIWRPVEDIQVSNRGRVKMPTSGKHTPNPGINGYCRVKVRGKTHMFHRLVCQAFHGEPPPGYHADHVDNNTMNNNAENLQWLSPAENNAKKRHACKKTTRRAVVTSMGEYYDSTAHAHAALGLSEIWIQQLCVSGKPHHEHGVFSYVTPEVSEGEIF